MKKRKAVNDEVIKDGHKQKVLPAKKSNASARKAFDAIVAGVREVAPPPPHDFLKFLEHVYRVGREVVSSPDLYAVAMSEHAALPPGTSANPAAVLISLAAPHVNPKNKSKYVTALTYAYKKKVKPSQLLKFLKQNGDLNGCCERWAAKYGRGRAKTKKRNPFRT